jgi:hypothetical protein
MYDRESFLSKSRVNFSSNSIGRHFFASSFFFRLYCSFLSRLFHPTSFLSFSFHLCSYTPFFRLIYFTRVPYPVLHQFFKFDCEILFGSFLRGQRRWLLPGSCAFVVVIGLLLPKLVFIGFPQARVNSKLYPAPAICSPFYFYLGTGRQRVNRGQTNNTGRV